MRDLNNPLNISKVNLGIIINPMYNMLLEIKGLYINFPKNNRIDRLNLTIPVPVSKIMQNAYINLSNLYVFVCA